MAYFSCSLMLEPGSEIRPGNWGRILRIVGARHTEWQRETILEQVRQAEFSNLPSRFDCSFVIDDLAEAQYYSARHGPISLLYQVTLIDEGASFHVADWKGTGPYDTLEWACRYWRGDVMPHPEIACALTRRSLERLSPRRQ
jgi:hypothetical protein